MRLLPLLCLLGCASDPEPCETLCDLGGFKNVEKFLDTVYTCTCSASDGLGGGMEAADCETYCADLGQSDGTVNQERDEEWSCTCGA